MLFVFWQRKGLRDPSSSSASHLSEWTFWLFLSLQGRAEQLQQGPLLAFCSSTMQIQKQESPRYLDLHVFSSSPLLPFVLGVNGRCLASQLGLTGASHS